MKKCNKCLRTTETFFGLCLACYIRQFTTMHIYRKFRNEPNAWLGIEFEFLFLRNKYRESLPSLNGLKDLILLELIWLWSVEKCLMTIENVKFVMLSQSYFSTYVSSVFWSLIQLHLSISELILLRLVFG